MEFKTAEEACRKFNKPSSSNIRDCCRGKTKTAYGFKWEYII